MEITFSGHTIAFGPDMSPLQKTSVLNAVARTYRKLAIETEYASRDLLAEKIAEIEQLYWLILG